MKKLLLVLLLGAATTSSGYCRAGGWFVDIFTNNNCGYYNQPAYYQPVVTYCQPAPVYYQQPVYYYQQPAPVYYQQPYYGGSSIHFGTYNNGCNYRNRWN